MVATGNNVFLAWLKKHEKLNKEDSFPLTWDTMIADPSMQKAIAGSSKARILYSYVENAIARDHATLIDRKLREAIEGFGYEDYVNTEGFAKANKRTAKQQQYAAVYGVLEWYIKNDILQHTNRDSRLNAFRRWITVAELLLKRHNYDGAALVGFYLVALNTDLKCDNELPAACKKKYDDLLTLISPCGNYKMLNQRMAAYKHPDDLMPMFLVSRQITPLNDVLGEEANRDINDVRPKEKLYRCHKSRHELIKKFIRKESNKDFSLPEHLNKTFHRAQYYWKTSSKVEIPAAACGRQDSSNSVKSLKNSVFSLFRINTQVADRPVTSSQLYSKGLLPSFWSRGGRSPENYWDRMFSIDSQNKILP
ncbi:RasGEF domain-containing protein [Legionella spiritensis]|uniref:Ras-GEF domain-containing protein n=1 Tax=Legionella spiritensis TaxID=452 RepID=A0A0W0Z7W1_LEGSP|nr:RasGEF domain-containing protein [Legionella spiritensis]KTD65221.1 hypothetical protein Lspi_0773 [Legionella spiritensis]SNV39680.1 Uncharacterised protein [Legionella spiritensis]